MKNNLFVFLCIIFFGCSNKKEIPANIIDLPKMASVMSDIMAAEHYIKQYSMPRDSAKVLFHKKFKVQIVENHHINMADFDSSFVWYSQKAERYEKLMLAVEDSLKIRRAKKQLFAYPIK